MSKILRQECPVIVLGVECRAYNVIGKDNGAAPSRILNQKIVTRRSFKEAGRDYSLTVELRLDDECKNDHETFAITGEIRDSKGRVESCGCLHDDIARVFPEFAPLIKWHLTSTDGPLHYIANTLHHAGDRDCWGLRKGEKRQRKTRSGALMWELEAVNALGVKLSTTPTGLQYQGAETVPLFILEKSHTGDTPPATPVLQWVPAYQVGEGKERELDHARSAAVWPEATDEELCQEPEDLKKALESRLPGLMAEFRTAMIGAGFMCPSLF